MNISGNIRNILLATLWALAGAGMLVLLIAAINKKNGKTCAGIEIQINAVGHRLFLDQKDVLRLLMAGEKENIKGKAIMSFELRKMEDRIKKNAWVRDVQLFFDNNEILRVRVTEKEPIARIFTKGGNSFYMDSSGAQLPLADRYYARLPVFTSFPSEKLRLHGPDSILVRQIKKLGWMIYKDRFWMAQIEQVDISAGKNFEMVPVVGQHLVEFGDGEDCEQKFHRLFVFYKEVLSKTGFDKYSQLDVQFAGQVIGTRRGGDRSRIDSIRAIRNIEKLIKSAQQLQADTVHQQNMKPLEHNTVTEQTLKNYDLVPVDGDSTQPKQPN